MGQGVLETTKEKISDGTLRDIEIMTFNIPTATICGVKGTSLRYRKASSEALQRSKANEILPKGLTLEGGIAELFKLQNLHLDQINAVNLLGDNSDIKLIKLHFDELRIQGLDYKNLQLIDLSLNRYNNQNTVEYNSVVSELNVAKGFGLLVLKNLDIMVPQISKKTIEYMLGNRQNSGGYFDITVPNLVDFYLPKY